MEVKQMARKALKIGLLVLVLLVSAVMLVAAEQPLEDLLPQRALGFTLEPFDNRGGPLPPAPSICEQNPDTAARLPLAGYPNFCFPGSGYWQALTEISDEHPDLEVEEYRQVIGGNDQIGIAVMVFKMEDEHKASQAAQLFTDTIQWHFPRSYRGTGIAEWGYCPFVTGLGCFSAYEEFSQLNRKSYTSGGSRLTFTIWLRRTSIPSSNVFSPAYNPDFDRDRFVGFFGTATFTAGNLVFFLALDDYLKLEFPDDWTFSLGKLGLFGHWRCYVDADENIRCEVETQKLNLNQGGFEEQTHIIKTNENLDDFKGALTSLIKTALEAAASASP